MKCMFVYLVLILAFVCCTAASCDGDADPPGCFYENSKGMLVCP